MNTGDLPTFKTSPEPFCMILSYSLNSSEVENISLFLSFNLHLSVYMHEQLQRQGSHMIIWYSTYKILHFNNNFKWETNAYVEAVYLFLYFPI